MLNKNINIDLHIHSKASEYKETSGFVDNGTIENLPTLFSALEKNNIGLFSITDHNRFNVELYLECKKIIASKSYPSVQGIVAGVEFDVLLEDDMHPCHIVTIFDAKNNNDYLSIDHVIKLNLLKNPKDYYTREKYEEILRKIGLNTLLIVHQKTSLDRVDKTTKSLSGSVANPYKAIKVGYINALEYQKIKLKEF